MPRAPALIFITSVLLFAIGYSNAYATQIHAPAVLSSNGSGVLTMIRLNLTRGTGVVKIVGPSSVGEDTQQSASIAAAYAANYTHDAFNEYNFTYSIGNSSSNVSGPSAGLAFTLLAIAALKGQQLFSNFTVTGTISSNGAVGPVGGVYDKIGAAAHDGMLYAMVPTVPTDTPEYLAYYMIQQKSGIPVIEVSNVSQALPYAMSNSVGITKPIVFNESRDYYVSGLPDANATCTCNESYFTTLINYTLGFTSSWINSISGNLGDARAALANNNNIYRNISSKGYHYTAADLAFVQFPEEYVLTHANNLTEFDVQSTLTNVSIYCSSLTAPPLTNLNYEYVIGGQLRQEWSGINLQESQTLLNISEDTDDYVSVLYSIASSYAWCSTAGEMYNIASSIGGNPVGYSVSTEDDAVSALNTAKQLGSNLYISAATDAYNNSQYGPALYGAAYADALYSTSLQNYTAAQLSQMLVADDANITNSIWATEFANSAEFSLYEANAHGGNTAANLTSVYDTSLLSIGLAKANKEIAESLVPANMSLPQTVTGTGIGTGTPSNIMQLLNNQTKAIASLRTEIYELYVLLLVFAVILVIVTVLMYLMHIRIKKQQLQTRRRQARLQAK